MPRRCISTARAAAAAAHAGPTVALAAAATAAVALSGCGPWTPINPPYARKVFRFLLERRDARRAFAVTELVDAVGPPDRRVSLDDLESLLAQEAGRTEIDPEAPPRRRDDPVARQMQTVMDSYLAVVRWPPGQTRPARPRWRDAPGLSDCEAWLYLWDEPYKTRFRMSRGLFDDQYAVESHSFFFVVRRDRVLGCDVLTRRGGA